MELLQLALIDVLLHCRNVSCFTQKQNRQPRAKQAKA